MRHAATRSRDTDFHKSARFQDLALGFHRYRCDPSHATKASCSCNASSIIAQILHRFQKPSGISRRRSSHPLIKKRLVARSFAAAFQSQETVGSRSVASGLDRLCSIHFVSRSQTCGCRLPSRRLFLQNTEPSGIRRARAFDVRFIAMTDWIGR